MRCWVHERPLPPHALARMEERGIQSSEVIAAIETGERFPAKYGREGFRKDFPFNASWQGKQYGKKQVEAYVVFEKDDCIVITALAKYY